MGKKKQKYLVHKRHNSYVEKSERNKYFLELIRNYGEVVECIVRIQSLTILPHSKNE